MYYYLYDFCISLYLHNIRVYFIRKLFYDEYKDLIPITKILYFQVKL